MIQRLIDERRLRLVRGQSAPRRYKIIARGGTFEADSTDRFELRSPSGQRVVKQPAQLTTDDLVPFYGRVLSVTPC